MPMLRWTSVVACIFPLAAGAAPSVVAQDGELWRLENDQIRVVVDRQSGTHTVLDRRCNYTWRTPRVSTAKRASPQVVVRRTESAPRIDGELAEWQSTSLIQIAHAMVADARNVDSDRDCSAQVWCSWDQRRLYLAVRVCDDCACFGEPGLKQWWERDGIELWAGGRQVGLNLSPGGSEARTAESAIAGGDIKLKTTDGGYVVEAALSWKLLGRPVPQLGERFPFAIGVNDADSDAGREGQIYFPSTWKHSNPETFAEAALGDAKGQVPALADLREQAKYRNVRQVANGIQFETEVKARGQKVPIVVTLTVPGEGADLIVDVDMPNRDRDLPYFVAVPPLGLDTPNGAYAIADYCNGHLYPLDLEPFPRWFMAANRIDMPWVGIVDVDRGQGYALILDTSDDCGVRMRKCRVNGRTTLAPVVEWWASDRRFRYVRRMRYRFCADGGHVALAKAYRSHAERLGLIVPFAEKVKENPNIERLFGAPDVWGNASLQFAREAKALGVDKMLIHGRSNPEDMAKINELGYLTSTYDNYTDILPLDEEHPDIDRNRAPLPDHAVLKADGKRMTAWLTFDKKTQYMKRCPSQWVPAAKVVIPKEIAKYPYLGRFIDVTTAEALYECFDPKHPLTRPQKRECGVALESYVRSLGLVVGGEHGLWWGVPHMDYIEGMMSGGNYSWPAGHLKHPKTKDEEFTSPWGRKHPPFERYERLGIGHEYRVPLWELVFHDCIVSTWYWGDASDWLLDAAPEITAKKDAFNVLYGTMPLLWANGGGSWVKEREVFLRTYRNTCKLHEQIAGERMLTHEFVTPDRAVQRTVFSLGTECVVNFGKEPRQVTVRGETFLLPQNGWVVRGPEIQQSLVLVDGQPVTTIQTMGYYYTDAGGVQVTMRGMDENRIRVVLSGSGGKVHVKPNAVTPRWDFGTTRVYELDKVGRRAAAVEHAVAADTIVLTAPGKAARLEALCGRATSAPDLAVTRAQAPTAEVQQGTNLAMTAVVRNLGFVRAKGVVTVYADQAHEALALASRDVVLSGNSSQTMQFDVPTDRIDGRRGLVVQAKLDGGEEELCERNNVRTLAVSVKPDWATWSARVPIVVDAGQVDRVDEPVVLPIDLKPIGERLGLAGALDLDSLRVAECDTQGQLEQLVPAQFDSSATGGELCWLLPGHTPKGTRRHFALLLRPKGAAGLLPAAGRMWDAESATVDSVGYVAQFTDGVITSLAPKVNGEVGPEFLRNLILSSKATGWSNEEAATVERFEAVHTGPVRCVVVVRKKLKADVVYEKTYTFYPQRIDLKIDVNKQAGGLYSRAHYDLPCTYVDDKGITAQVDGNGAENQSTYGKNKNPRWLALLGKGWAHSCIALSKFDHVAYWDGGYLGAIGFVGGPQRNARMSYVVHREQQDASFAELDWQRLGNPVSVKIVE